MVPSLRHDKSIETEADKCSLPFLDPNGHIVFFDIQSAEAGTFTIPGVVDLEVYEPAKLVEVAWVYFKGDPMSGPQRGHPFDMPFHNDTKFSIDLVRDEDTSTAIEQIMAPVNSSVFWEGGAPFGKNGQHTIYIPRLDPSCKYAYIGEMIFRWNVTGGLDEDPVLRLKLTTDDPPTMHLSGKLRISNDPQSISLSVLESGAESCKHSWDSIISIWVMGFLLVLFSSWIMVRKYRKCQRIALP